MAEAGSGGGTGGQGDKDKDKNGGGGPKYPEPPSESGAGSGNSGNGGGGGSSSSSSTTGSGAGSGGGGGGDPYGYRKKAGKRYLKQAANLEAQARALRHALRVDLGKNLRQSLQNINTDLKDADQLLMEGYRKRVAELRGSVEDNEKAAAGATEAAASNMARERASAMSEIAMQGAGESDALAAQLMSLRNWQANQGEVNRSLFDTLRSANSSLTDTTIDYKGQRASAEVQANADREMLWTTFYNRKSEILTQLGNIRGQQADYRDMAQEMGVGKGGGTKAMERAYMAASKTMGKAYKDPGVSDKVMEWDGAKRFTASNPAGKLQEAQTVDLSERPEGATLRSW